MRPHLLVVLAACGGGGESPGIASRNPSLAVSDAITPISEGSLNGRRHAVIQVELVSDVCAPLDGSFGGTFRGAPMTVASPGAPEPAAASVRTHYP